ncbi:MAG TPA: hypothetical protein VI790_04100 [Candidatus Nanoarchaeia archaeon]|nr:hypothetical protein [Candidatus Nanoarchaeia archaeon]
MIDVLSLIELVISIGIAIMMANIFRSYRKSGIKSLMLNITLAYITFGISTTNRFLINSVFELSTVNSPLYDLLTLINYGVIFLALFFAMRAVHYARLLVQGFGDLDFAKKKEANNK